MSFAALSLLTSCRPTGLEPKSHRYPGKASNPSPADGAKGVSPDTKLSWIGDRGASYNVYFGTESPPLFVGRQSATTFNPGPLEWDQIYYWKVDIVGGAEGDIWRFTTFWYGDPNSEEMNVRLQVKNKSKKYVFLRK